jgi:hypothetical protein
MAAVLLLPGSDTGFRASAARGRLVAISGDS